MADVFARLRTAEDFALDEVTDVKLISRTNQTLVQEAIARRPEFVIPLIERGVPLDHQDDNGQTALQYVIARSQVDVARILLDAGANPNLLDKYGNSALWTAVMNPKADIALIKAIYERGGDPDLRNKAGRSVADMVRTKNNGALKQMFGIEA